MLKRIYLPLYFSLFVLPAFLSAQTYYCTLHLHDGVDLPFQLKIGGQGKLDLINGDEIIPLQFSAKNGDSLKYYFPVFDAGFVLKINNNPAMGSVKGYYFTNYRKINIPLTGYTQDVNNQLSFPDTTGFSGEWKMVFSPGTKDSSIAIGEFSIDKQGHANGTILTPSGDYRYLHGYIADNKMKVFTIDGVHIYAFIMAKNPPPSIPPKGGGPKGGMEGTQYSGTWGHEDFICTRQPGFQLPDAYSLVKMKPGKTTLGFVLYDDKGKPISLNSPEYAGKPMLLQIMGSWCPNCMDESRYIISQYAAWHTKGLDVLGLSFEKYDDTATAYHRINKMRADLDMPYTAALAGKANVKAVLQLLPEIEGDVSFPTLIALDKNHQVKWIHTGFSGPATGMVFLQWKQEMEKEVIKLLGY